MARDTATNASSTEDANDKSKDKTSGKSKDEKDKKDEVEELVCLGRELSWLFAGTVSV